MGSRKKISLLACMFVLIVIGSCSYDQAVQNRPMEGKTDVDIVLEKQTEEDSSDTAGEQKSVISIEENPVADTGEPEEDKDSEEVTEKPAEVIDIDLTVLSSTMVYSEVFNMMYYPENYVGKSIKMEGLYATAYDETSDKRFHACIIQDATACCSQGIEFEPEGDLAYPDDFPNEGESVCVTGVFDIYNEGEQTYCTLRNAKLL